MAVLVPSIGLGQASAPPPRIASQQSPTPAYDVISVKLNKSGSGGMSIRTHYGSFAATNISLKSLLVNAYNIREGLIFGLPGWAESARFDVDAKIVDPDEAALKKLAPEQYRAMLLPILTERFHAQVHTETKTLPTYDLVIDRNGAKLKENVAPHIGTDSAKPQNGPGMSYGNGMMTMTMMPVSSLAYSLSGELDRTVVDKTGLTSTYDLHLKWTPEGAAASGPDNGQPTGLDDTAPSLFTALQEQLGLKLQPSKGPVVTLAVDHIEMPTEN